MHAATQVSTVLEICKNLCTKYALLFLWVKVKWFQCADNIYIHLKYSYELVVEIN